MLIDGIDTLLPSLPAHAVHQPPPSLALSDSVTCIPHVHITGSMFCP